jgi:HK97 family phage prohead protease
VIGPAKLPDGLERRAAIELRATGRRLEGMAATFNTPARIGGFEERIMPGAFRGSLASGADVLALVDHDPGRLLARTSSGTLRLAETGLGLAFEIDVPDTQLGRDVLALAERRDLGGMSFGFRVQDEAWPARDKRELRAVELVEVSIVHAWPAYQNTSVAARARAAGGFDAMARRRFLETL